MSPANVLKRAKQRPLFWVIAVVGLILITVILSMMDLDSLHKKAEDLNGWLVFLIMAFAPLVGFPASAVYVVAGAKYGTWWAMVLVEAAIVIHLVGAWWIAHSWLRRLLNRILKRLEIKVPRIPKGEAVPICLLVALLPGISYTLKNYLLVLAGARFQPFFWTCLAANSFHASLAVFFGDFTSDLNPPRIIFLVAYGIALTGLSHYVVRRLRRRRKREREAEQAPGAEGDPG